MPKFQKAWFVLVLLIAPPLAQAQRTWEHAADRQPFRPAARAAEKTPELAQVKKEIVTLTNAFRRKHDRGGLRVNADLSRAAQSFAEYLAQTDKFSHTADGKEPWDRVAKAGYAYAMVAENIAMEFNSAGFRTRELAEKFMTGWENSPPHRKNLLDADLEEIGVGIARSKKTGRYYAVQDFGRPKSATVDFSIHNDAGAVVRYQVDGKSFTLQPGYTVTHERGRPPKLAFQTGQGEPVVYQPFKDELFTVQRGPGGRLQVQHD